MHRPVADVKRWGSREKLWFPMAALVEGMWLLFLVWMAWQA